MNWFLLGSYIRFCFKKKNKIKHSLTSNYIEDLIYKALYEKNPYYSFDDIQDLRTDLLNSKQKIKVTDFGAGSKKFKSNERSIRDLVRYNASSRKQGEFIFRLILQHKPQNIIELGTSLGIGTLYLALPDSRAKVYTIEGCKEIAEVAAANLKKLKVNNVIQRVGVFKSELPKVLDKLDEVQMVYFDGHHDYQATLKYFKLCLQKASKSAIFIFDDIYWSAGMKKAWCEIIDHQSVSVSLDLFKLGIVIINMEVKKSHHISNYNSY